MTNQNYRVIIPLEEVNEVNIDVNNIISASDISADTKEINDKLADNPELIVFDNNKPQFVILSLERYEQISSIEVKNETNTSKPDIKIGKYVQDTFLKLIDKDMLPSSEIDNLCELEYSNVTFNLNFPMLKEFDPNPEIPIDVQKKDKNGYNRYYKYLINCNDKQYLLCSQWNEHLHRKKYIEWLNKWRHSLEED